MTKGLQIAPKFDFLISQPAQRLRQKYTRSTLENVAVAHALQFEAARAMPALYDAMPSLKSLNLYCRIIAFYLLIHYFML